MVLGKGLYIKKYQVYSPKLPLSFDGFRFIFISDLHGKKYGKNNTKLLEMIYKAKPECILIGGDMVVGGISRRCKEGYRPLSKETVNTSIDLIAELTSKYTVIHALGNHEEKLHPALWDEYKSKLKELNVKLLDNEKFSFHRENDDYIDIYGLSLGEENYPKFRRSKLSLDSVEEKLGEKGGNYTILMAHSPLYFETYSRWKADLTLSGHLHGGIMRLPFVGGVIGPDFFIFPKYSGGFYSENGSNMIVSCGAGTHTINLRVFNPPEITLVELKFGEKLHGN